MYNQNNAPNLYQYLQWRKNQANSIFNNHPTRSDADIVEIFKNNYQKDFTTSGFVQEVVNGTLYGVSLEEGCYKLYLKIGAV